MFSKNQNKKFLGSPPTTFSRKSGGGFTVIELLVVVAVLGLLSSIILVSTRGARGKAQIAKVLQYSASLHHLLGVDIVGEWKFEDNFNDTSGNGNNGTGFGGITFPNNDASPQLGKAGSFDGVDDYVNLGNNPVLDITGDFTIEFWMYPRVLTGAYSNGSIFAKRCSSDLTTPYQAFISYNAARLVLGSGSNAITVYSPTLKVNEWQHIAFTISGTTMKAYRNTVVGTPATFSGTRQSDPACALYLGKYGTSNSYWYNGLLDEFRIYSQAFSARQIQKLYAEGLKKFQLADN